MEDQREITDSIQTIPIQNTIKISQEEQRITAPFYNQNIAYFLNYCRRPDERYLQAINKSFSLELILSAVNSRGNTGLMLSIISQSKEAFSLILEIVRTNIMTGQSVKGIMSYLNGYNMHGHNALHISLFTRNKEMVQGLLGIGCNPLAVDYQLRNVYHHIAYENIRGFSEAIHTSLMQSYGGNAYEIENILLSTKDGEGMTPIHVAIERHKRLNLIRELLNPATSYDPEEREILGKSLIVLTGKCNSSVLHLAAATGDAQIVSYLIQHIPIAHRSEIVNLQNGRGDTALHVAVAWNHLDCAQELLNYGCSQSQMNREEELPEVYCTSNEMSKILNAPSQSISNM